MGSWFFVWCFTRVALLLLKIFCLARLSLPGLLAKEIPFSLGFFFFFFSLPVGVSRLPAFQLQVKQKENPGNSLSCSSGPEIPRQSATFSHLSQTSYVCFICMAFSYT